ncbi:hypothetical protein NMG60_11021646 [Bertholletia excelsa]
MPLSSHGFLAPDLALLDKPRTVSGLHQKPIRYWR